MSSTLELLRLLAALTWLTTMGLLTGWANTTAALETALAVTAVAGQVVAAPDWKRHGRPGPARDRPRRVLP